MRYKAVTYKAIQLLLLVILLMFSFKNPAIADYSGFFYDGVSYQSFHVPGDAINTFAFGINNSNTIVGSYQDHNKMWYGFIYNGINFNTLTYPNSGPTLARAINNSGIIVGDCRVDNIGRTFMYDNGTYTLLPLPNISNITDMGASGINDNGQIVGHVICRFGPNVNDIKSYGYVYDYINGNYVFPWGAETFGPLDINNKGKISGTSNKIYDLNSNQFISLPNPISSTQRLVGINDSGEIVVVYNTSFIYKDGLYSSIMVPSDNPPLVTEYTDAYGINDFGNIVGGYSSGLVPLPPSVLLLGCGLLGLAGWRRFRKG